MKESDFPKVRIYTPAEIKEIRKGLKDTRARFCRRFLVSEETIKGWEIGRRNPQGPSLVILQQLERVVREKQEEKNRSLERFRSGKRCRLKTTGTTPDRARKEVR